MKRKFILSLFLVLSIFTKNLAQNINMGFEGSCSNPSNAFFTGCFPNWISACGSPDVSSNTSGISAFEGSKYVHMYGAWRGFSCLGNTDAVKSRTEGIVLNYNFQQGYTYQVKYAVQWKSANSTCLSHNINWILTNGLANQTGTWQSCANDGGRTPDIPGGSVTVENFALPSGNSTAWQQRSFTFTPSANFTQLTVLNPVRPKPGSGCASNLDGFGDVFLDGFSLTVICDPNDNSLFTTTTACNNGVLTVNVTANDLDPANQWWGLYQTNTPIADGGTLVAQVGGAGGPTTASFTITDFSKFYYIKHGIWGDCYDWRETRYQIPMPQADANFFFYDWLGIQKNTFCFGEVINMYAFSNTPVTSYYIDAWRRPTGSPASTPFSWYGGLGWATGEPGSINLTTAFGSLATPVYFEPGYEYEIKLAVSNPSLCIGWSEVKQRFTVVCCNNFNPCYQLDPEPNFGQKSNTLWARNFNTYWFTAGAVHEWYVLSSPNPSGGPYTLVNTVTSTNQTEVLLYNNAQYGVQYKVIHKVKTKCGDFCCAQSDCANCRTGEIVNDKIDCSILDSILCAVAAPKNLKASCLGQQFAWDAVPGAIGYSIEVSFNDPACCTTRYPNSGFLWNTLTTNSLPFSSLGNTPYDCIRWRVRAKCANGTFGPWSDYKCFFSCNLVGETGGGEVVVTDGTVKRSLVANAALEPRISPNPNKGEMTLSLQTPGDLVMSIDVVNAQGSRIKTIARNTYKGGQFNSKLNLGPVAKGVYTIVFNTNYGTFRKKVVVQ